MTFLLDLNLRLAPASGNRALGLLSKPHWPEKFAKVSVRRGRPPPANPKVSTTIRLSQDMIDHFKAAGRGWQTRIDNALRDWIRTQDTA